MAYQFYPLMKAKDPTITVGIDIAFGNLTSGTRSDTWHPTVLASAKYDFVEMHHYPEHNNQDDDNALHPIRHLILVQSNHQPAVRRTTKPQNLIIS